MNRTVRKNSLLFLAGSGLYPLLEVLWRGYSHASMALAGGVCLLLINAVCCEKMKRRSLPARCAIGSLIITVVEFLFGLLVNRVLHLHVWDYSALPLNIMGQICLPFSLIWFVLTIPASALCKLLLPPFRLPGRDKISLGHHRPLIYFWNTGKMPILSGACNGICGNAS